MGHDQIPFVLESQKLLYGKGTPEMGTIISYS